MDWIFDNFQIVALIALALASWLKTRMDAKAAEREERRGREEMPEGEDVFGPDEEWRIPEVPAPSVPPPLVKVSPPPIPMAAFEAGREAEAVLKHQMDLQERLRQIRDTKAVTSGGAAATRSRTASQQTGYVQPLASAGLRGALRSSSQSRRAIVLREILGPPLGLR